MTACATCRFRLMINSDKFHCAAHFGPNGWAYIWSLKEDWRGPHDCEHHIPGRGLTVGHELKFSEFCEISGKQIHAEDWETFKARKGK